MSTAGGSRCSRCGAELNDGEACTRCLLHVATQEAPPGNSDDRSWLAAFSEEGTASQTYEVLDEIARGGMGVVYRARHRKLNRTVALKMILPHQLHSPAALQRFRAEAQAVAALDHPAILPIYEVGELDGLPFFSMKLAQGGSLAEQTANWRERPREAAELIARVARAVHHAHERGILHRDLKPGNILLGESGEPYVTDFGIAKWLDRESGLTLDISSLGTPHYIAPEQASGAKDKITRTADVYSLGAILYELLTGRPPFTAETAVETLRLVIDADPIPPRVLNPAIRRDLEVICLKCLEKEPAARYRSAAELADDLQRWLDRRPITARAAGPFNRGWRWVRRNRALAALIAIVALLVPAIVYQRYAGGVAAVNTRSIAVLPFKDESSTHDQQFLGDGLGEEIIASLSKVPELRVIARTSSFSFRSKEADVRAIGRDLHVGSIVTGAIERTGDHLRITAELLNARDGSVAWSQIYQRELQDFAVVGDEISRGISGRLQLAVSTTPQTQTAHDPQAYDLYFRGLYFSNKSSEEDLHKALNLFQAALDKDPTFAPAWSGIGKTWSWLADQYVKPLDGYALAKAACLKALALNDRDAEAHAYLGEAERVLDWNYAADESELRRALQIDPNSASAHMFLALLLAAKWSDKEALEQMQAARAADPLSPIVSTFSAQLFLITDRLDDAVAAGRRTSELDVNYNYFDDALAAAYRERGQLSESIALYEKLQSLTHTPHPGLAIAYARAGRLDDARRVLTQLVELSQKQYIGGEEIASVYVALGENDEAFRWLERAIADHSSPLEGIGRRRALRPLYADPRFPQLLRRIGLDPRQ